MEKNKNHHLSFKESRFKLIQSTSNTNVQNGGKLINLQKIKKTYHKFANKKKKVGNQSTLQNNLMVAKKNSP
jgi:hypothetical protein